MKQMVELEEVLTVELLALIKGFGRFGGFGRAVFGDFGRVIDSGHGGCSSLSVTFD